MSFDFGLSCHFEAQNAVLRESWGAGKVERMAHVLRLRSCAGMSGRSRLPVCLHSYA